MGQSDERDGSAVVSPDEGDEFLHDGDREHDGECSEAVLRTGGGEEVGYILGEREAHTGHV